MANKTTFEVRVGTVTGAEEEGKASYFADGHIKVSDDRTIYVQFVTEGEERESLMAAICRGETPKVAVHVSRMRSVDIRRF